MNQRRWLAGVTALPASASAMWYTAEERSTESILSEDYYVERTTFGNHCPFGAGVKVAVSGESSETHLWCKGQTWETSNCSTLDNALAGPDFLWDEVHGWHYKNAAGAVTYQSVDPRVASSDYQSDLSFLDGGGDLYDLAGADVAVGGSVSVSCDDNGDWNILENVYCKHANIAASYHSNQDIVDKQCMNRCLPESFISRVSDHQTSIVNTPGQAISASCAAGSTFQTCGAYGVSVGAAGVSTESSCQVTEDSEGTPFQPFTTENVPTLYSGNAVAIVETTITSVVGNGDGTTTTIDNGDGTTTVVDNGDETFNTTWLRPTTQISSVGDMKLYDAIAFCAAPGDSFSDTYPYYYFIGADFETVVCLTQADLDAGVAAANAASVNYTCSTGADNFALPDSNVPTWTDTHVNATFDASQRCLFSASLRTSVVSDAYCVKTGDIADWQDCYKSGQTDDECNSGVKAVVRTDNGWQRITAADALANYDLECSYDAYGDRAVATFNGTIATDNADPVSGRTFIGAANLYASCNHRSVQPISSSHVVNNAGTCSKYIEGPVDFATATTQVSVSLLDGNSDRRSGYIQQINTVFNSDTSQNENDDITVSYHDGTGFQSTTLNSTQWTDAQVTALISFQDAQSGMTFTMLDGTTVVTGSVTGVTYQSGTTIVDSISVAYTNSNGNAVTSTWFTSDWTQNHVLVDDTVFAIEATCSVDNSDAIGGCTEFLQSGTAFQHDVNALCGSRQEILDTCAAEPSCASVDFSRWGSIAYLNTADCDTSSAAEDFADQCVDGSLCTNSDWDVFIKVAPGDRDAYLKWNDRDLFSTFTQVPNRICLDSSPGAGATDSLAQAQADCRGDPSCAGFTEKITASTTEFFFFDGAQGAGCQQSIAVSEKEGARHNIYNLNVVDVCSATVSGTSGTSVDFNDNYVVETVESGDVSASFKTADNSKRLSYSSTTGWKLQKNNLFANINEGRFQCLDYSSGAWDLANFVFCAGLNATDCDAAASDSGAPLCDWVPTNTGPESFCRFRHHDTGDVCNFYQHLGLDSHAEYGAAFESQCALSFRDAHYYETHTGATTFYNDNAKYPMTGGNACLSDNDDAFNQLFGLLTTANLTGVTAQCQNFADDSFTSGLVNDDGSVPTNLFARGDGYVDLCDNHAPSQYSSADVYKSSGLLDVVRNVCAYTCSGYYSAPPDAPVPPTDEGSSAGQYPNRRRLDDLWAAQLQDHSIVYDVNGDWTTELATTSHLALGTTGTAPGIVGYEVNEHLANNGVSFYSVEPPTVSATSELVCVEKKDCTDGATCIVGNRWMEDFDASAYSGMNVAVISPLQSTAVMQSGYFELVNNLRLNKHGATTYEVKSMVGSEMLVSLAPGSPATDGSGLTSWHSELITVNSDGTTGSVVIEVCASEWDTHWSDSDGVMVASGGQSVTAIPGTNGRCYDVAVDVADAAVSVTLYQDFDECPGACGDHAQCANNIRAPATCTCAESHGYVCDTGATGSSHCAGNCVAVMQTYDTNTAKSYFSVEHWGRMDNGWCVTGITSYADPDCAGEPLEIQSVLPTVADVVSSEAGTDASGLANQDPEDYWCSNYLNLNPLKSVDNTHPANTRLTFTASAQARCIRLANGFADASGHVTAKAGEDELILEARTSASGPVVRKWLGKEADSSGVVHFNLDEDARRGGVYGGQPGYECFNDVLDTGDDGEFGVSHGATTALECEDLCMKNVDCMSFTFRPAGDFSDSSFDSDASQTVCKLHGEPCRKVAVQCGSSSSSSDGESMDMTMGMDQDTNDGTMDIDMGMGGRDFPRRLSQHAGSCSYGGNVPLTIDSISANGAAAVDGVLEVAAGESFSLALHARHLPFNSDRKKDLSKGQRLKLVHTGNHQTDLTSVCLQAIPSDVHGVRCSKNRDGYHTICTKKPTSADSATAVFGEFSVDANSADSYYNICYCESGCHQLQMWSLLKTASGSAFAVKTPGSAHTWSLTQGANGNTVPRMSSDSDFTITVSGQQDATTGYDLWRLKIVDPEFSCSVTMDSCADSSNTGSCTFSDADDSYAPAFNFIKHNTGADKIGDWRVCFSPDNGATWDGIANAADSQTFHLGPADGEDLSVAAVHSNQFLSALATDGTRAEPVVVSGQNLVTTQSSQNMLALNKFGSCGDNSHWRYTSGNAQCNSKNSNQPSFLHSGSTYNGATVANYPDGISDSNAYGRGSWISLAFDGAIACPASDVGSITLRASDDQTNVVATYDCNAAAASGDLMIVENELFLYVDIDVGATLPTSSVFVDFEAGAIDAMCGSGNAAFNTNFGQTGYYVQLNEGWPSTTDSRLIAVTPYPGKVAVSSSEDMIAHFNVPVYVDEATSFTATDCGDDLVCGSSDDVAQTRSSDTVTSGSGDDADGSDGQESNARHFNLGRVLADYGSQTRRHRICFPDGMFQSSGADLTFPDGAYCFEVVTGVAGEYLADFDYNFAYNVASASDSAFTVDVTLFEEVIGANSERTFQACMCIANDDDSLEARSDHSAGDFSDAVTMKYASKQTVNGGSIISDFSSSSMVVSGRPISDHVCENMCELGCTGPHCACDSYEFGSAGTPSHYVCGQEDELVAACKADDSCGGLAYNSDTNQAIFFTGAAYSEENVAWTLWTRETGAACTDVEDYSTYVGKLTVADNVNTGVRYVVEPEKLVSIEVTNANGKDLTNGVATLGLNSGASWDRIMVVDCKGQCGQAGPSEHVYVDGGRREGEKSLMAMWTGLSPLNFWRDTIWDAPVPADVGVAKHDYSSVSGTHCKGGNIDIFAAGLGRYSCFQQCGTGLSGPDCANMGFVPGQDEDRTSLAICMPHGAAAADSLATVQYLCDTLGECGSIDAHETIGRYYLNTVDCTETTGDNVHYVHHDKQALDSQESETTFHTGMDAPIAATDANDWPFSMPEMLRFAGIGFSTGGNFKVCYCDASATAGNRCTSATDFNVEVGKVHASGVSCLLADERMLNVLCVSQGYGGNRCYSGDAPTITPPAATVAQRDALRQAVPHEAYGSDLSAFWTSMTSP